MTRRLAAAGFAVAPCTEPAAACGQCTAGEPALWILDAASGGGDMLDFCRRLREGPAGGAHVIWLIADACDAAAPRAALQAGADDCLGLPLEAHWSDLRLAAARRRIEEFAKLRRAEDQLNEIIERYELAVLGAGEGLWVGSPIDGAVLAPEEHVWFSPRFKELIGFRDDEFPNVLGSFLSRLHPDDRERIERAVAEHFQSRTPYDIKYRLQNKQGEYRWFSARGQADWDESGRVVRIAGSLRDIDDAQKTAEELAASEEKWRSLVAHAPDTITLVDPGGTIRFMNRNWPGHTAAKSEGKSFFQFVPEAFQSRVREALDHAFQTGRPQRFEFGVPRPKGRKTWYANRVGPIQKQDGVAGLIIITTDISNRKNAEEERQKFVSLVENSGDFIAMIAADGQILYINPAGCRLVGLDDPDRAKTIPLAEYYAEPLGNLFRETIVRAVQETGRWTGEVQFRHFQTHQPIDVHQTVFYVLHPESGQPLCLATISRDISDRKQAEAALRGEQELLRRLIDLQERDRQLVAYEIHDGIAQKMAAALMHLEAFQHAEPGRGREELGRCVNLLSGAVDEARQLISGLRPPVLDEMGVVAAIEYLINEAREEVPDIEYRHETRFKRLAPALEAAIFRVVQEALNNVRKHSGSRRAEVELIEANDRLRLVVRDWGRGFDPSKINGDRFGLQGIRQRARLLGTTAQIESAPGKGTTVSLDFPLILDT